MNGSSKDAAEDSNKTTKPKPPLTAYNLYFQVERKRILEGTDSPFRDITGEEIKIVAAEHKAKTGKRPHRKTHGKIGFKELARLVANRWKKLDSGTKQILEDHAQIEKQDHRIRLEKWVKSDAYKKQEQEAQDKKDANDSLNKISKPTSQIGATTQNMKSSYILATDIREGISPDWVQFLSMCKDTATQYSGIQQSGHGGSLPFVHHIGGFTAAAAQKQQQQQQQQHRPVSASMSHILEASSHELSRSFPRCVSEEDCVKRSLPSANSHGVAIAEQSTTQANFHWERHLHQHHYPKPEDYQEFLSAADGDQYEPTPLFESAATAYAQLQSSNNLGLSYAADGLKHMGQLQQYKSLPMQHFYHDHMPLFSGNLRMASCPFVANQEEQDELYCLANKVEPVPSCRCRTG